MGRKIKFRGKSIKDNIYVYGDLLHKGTETYIVTFKKNKFSFVEVNPKTVGEYIGQNDANGNELYEGQQIKMTVDGYCRWEVDEAGRMVYRKKKMEDTFSYIGKIKHQGFALNNYIVKTDRVCALRNKTLGKGAKKIVGRRCETLTHVPPEVLEIQAAQRRRKLKLNKAPYCSHQQEAPAHQIINLPF